MTPAPLRSDMRPGENIPGYTGHVPRKASENVHGVTFRAANARASDNDRSEPAGQPLRPCVREDGRPALRALAAGGAGAFSPKDYAARFHTLNSQGPPEREGLMEPIRTVVDEPRSPTRPLSPGRAVPGYQGYVPSVKPENVYGATYRKVNEAATLGAVSDEPLTWTQSLSRAGSGRGLEIGSNIDQAPRRRRVTEAGRSGVSLALHGGPVRQAQSLQAPIGSPSGEGTLLGDGDGSGIAARVEEARNEGAPAAPSVEPRDFPVGRECLGEIPSHIDHVPRKGLTGYKSERVLGYPRGRPTTGEIPSHINHIPRKCRSMRYLRVSEKDDAAPAQNRPPASAEEARRLAGSLSPGRPSIAGYGGYVPKVGPRNVFGMSYTAANDTAAHSPADAETVNIQHLAVNEDNPSSSTRSGQVLSDRRRGIPGYQGYIPKTIPTNVIGATYGASVAVTVSGTDPVREAETETGRLQESSVVWQSWSMPMPAGEESGSPQKAVSKKGESRARAPNGRQAAGIILGDSVNAGSEGNAEGRTDGKETPLSLRSDTASRLPRAAWR